jgi:trans-2,3-dihydro-3-hydroxyanthranilate isomerase
VTMTRSASYRYRVVDVFTERPLEGNALAVFPDASAIDEVIMQKIAKELNLSETTFVLPPSQAACAARVRIFTPTKEMVFAGHPTIGTSFVMLDEGIVPRQIDHFLLEEKIGPVPVRVERVQLESGERPMIWLTTPPIEEGRTFDPALCATVLGLQRSDLQDHAPLRMRVRTRRACSSSHRRPKERIRVCSRRNMESSKIPRPVAQPVRSRPS